MAKRLAMEGSDILLGARKSPNVIFGDHIKGETYSFRNLKTEETFV